MSPVLSLHTHVIRYAAFHIVLMEAQQPMNPLTVRKSTAAEVDPVALLLLFVSSYHRRDHIVIA